jgi:hypothetical protein
MVISNFFKNSRRYLQFKCTTGINDTIGKFAPGVNLTGGIFATSINVTLPPVLPLISTTPVTTCHWYQQHGGKTLSRLHTP